MEIEWLSASAIRDYQHCPRASMMKRQERKAYSKRQSRQSPELLLGNALHATLRDLHRLCVHEQLGSQPTCDTYLYLAQRAVALLNANWSTDAFEDAHQEEAYFERAERMLEYYVRSSAMPKGKVLATEADLARTIRLGGRTLGLVGRVDRIDLLPQGTIEVIDYKLDTSGRMPSSQVLAYDLGTFAQYILTSLTYREYSTTISMSHLSLTTLRKVTVRYDEQHIRENLRALDALAQDIQAGKAEPRPNAWCPWCAFRVECPAFMVAGDLCDIAQILTDGANMEEHASLSDARTLGD